MSDGGVPVAAGEDRSLPRFVVRWLVRCISRLAPIYREAPYVLWRFHGAEVGLWGGSRQPGHPRSRRCVYKRAWLLALTFWNLRAALYICVFLLFPFFCLRLSPAPLTARGAAGGRGGSGGPTYCICMTLDRVKGEGSEGSARDFILSLS